MMNPDTNVMSRGQMGKGMMGGEMMQRMFRLFVCGQCNLFCVHLEMILRPHFGTRYFLILSVMFQAFTLEVANVISFLLPMLPRTGVNLNHEPITMDRLVLLFWGLCFVHVIRLSRRVRNMDLEKDSQSEEQAWPLFRGLPNGHSWAWQRMVYEPLFVVIVTVVLYRLDLLALIPLLYLLIGAVCLFTKAVLTYWEGWEYIRTGRDAMERARLIQRLVAGDKKGIPQRVGNIVMGSIANLPSEVQASVVGSQLPPDTDLPADLKALLRQQ